MKVFQRQIEVIHDFYNFWDYFLKIGHIIFHIQNIQYIHDIKYICLVSKLKKMNYYIIYLWDFMRPKSFLAISLKILYNVHVLIN